MSMEAMGQLKAVVMDKTGTLTHGDFRLHAAVSCGYLSEEELLRICAGCESHSTHPIAVSIVAAAKERGLPLTAPLELEEIPGVVVSPLEGSYLMWIDLGAHVSRENIQTFIQDSCRIAPDYGHWFFPEACDDCHIRLNLAAPRQTICKAAEQIKTALTQALGR
jgi:magnesium-transporting ATPase (P-type)